MTDTLQQSKMFQKSAGSIMQRTMHSIHYQCHQGKGKAKTQKEKYKHKVKAKLLSDHGSVAVKTRKLTQPTKKLDCAVIFDFKKIPRFPRFRIKNVTKWNRSVVSQEIRTLLEDIQNPRLTKKDDLNIAAEFEIGHLEYISKFPLRVS